MDIAGLLITYKADISDVGSQIASLKSGLSSVSDVAQSSTSSVTSALKQIGTAAESSSSGVVSAFKQISNVADIGKAITGTDVAEAKLALLESDVNKAREKLQTLQDAADAGKAVTGIDEAQAQLTLLEAKAQDAREKLQQMGTQGQESTEQLATGAREDTSVLEQLASGVRGVVPAIQEMGTSIAESGGSFMGRVKGMVGGVMEFGSQLGMTFMGLQMFGQTVQQVGNFLIGSNASMEQTTVAFKQLLGSSSAANAELKDLQSFAASTPFEFPELADATQKLLAFQYPLKTTKPLLTAIGDALSGLGENTAAKLDQVVSVFGQMKSSAHLMTGDVMQLTSVGINGFQILADQMHKPVSVIKDMISKGLIPANDGIEMLRKGMEKTFGGGMQAQSMTFNGLLSTLKDNASQALRAFTGPLFDAAKAGLEVLGNLVSSKSFQDFASGAGKSVADAFGKIGGAVKYVGEVLHSLNLTDLKEAWAAVSGEVGSLTNKFRDLLGSLNPLKQAKGDFDPIAEAIGKIAKAGLDTVVNAMWGISQALMAVDRAAVTGGLKEGLKQVGDALLNLGKAALNMSPLVNTIQGVARHGKELGEWWQASVIPALKQAEPGFRNLGQSIAGLLPAFEQIAQVVHNNFQKSFDALLPVFKQAIPVIIQLAGVLAGGLGTAIKFLTPYIVQAATAIAQFATDIATRVAPIITGFFNELHKDMPALKAIWDTIWPSLSVSLQAAWNAITTTVKIAWAIVTGIIKVGLDLMSGNWKQAWTDVQDTFKSIWESIKGYFVTAWNIIKGQVQDGVNKVKAQFQQLYDDLVGHSIVPDMINGIVNWFAQLPGRVMAFVGSLVAQAKAQFSAWMSAAIFIAGSIVNGIAGWFQQLPGRVGSAVQDAANRALGILNGLASSAWTAGMNVVSQIAAGITAGIGTVTTAIGNVVATIASHLPSSPAKTGPLRQLPQMGAKITQQIGEGMLSAQPTLQMQMAHVVQPYPIRPSASSIAAAVAPSLAVQSGTGGHTTIIEMDGQQMMEYVQKLTEAKVKLKLSPGRRAGRVA